MEAVPLLPPICVEVGANTDVALLLVETPAGELVGMTLEVATETEAGAEVGVEDATEEAVVE